MIEKRSFEGGMNQDMEESLIPSNQYRFALNIRTGDSGLGAKGVVTTIEGNRLVSTTLPAGGNRVIGTVDDDTNNRTVYVIYNTNGNNRILQYDHNANTITTIYEDTGNTLNLNVNYLITGIDVVVGEQDTYLLFTDNYGEPKNINIDAGIRTFDSIKKKFKGLWVAGTFAVPDDVYYMVKQFRQPNGTTTNVNIYYRCTAGTSSDPSASGTPVPNDGWEVCPSGYIYTSVNEEFTTAIVKPPLSPPLVQYNTNYYKNFNNLANAMWQFKYCYVAEDGRESAWSPISTFVNPQSRADGAVLSQVDGLQYFNNELNVWAEVPDFIKYRYIKIAVRKNNDDDAPGDFYLTEKIDINSIENIMSTDPTGGTNYKLYTRITFDNTGNLLPINAQQANQLFSWIPVKAKAQAITDKNRIIYANITEGRDIDLQGKNGYNSKPPTLAFYETGNPFLSYGGTLGVTSNGGTTVRALTATEIREGRYNQFSIYNPTALSAAAVVTFSGSVVVGLPVSITVTLSISNSNPALFWNSSYPITQSRSFTHTVYPKTTSTVDLINEFVSFFNSNSVFNLPVGNNGSIVTFNGLVAALGGTTRLFLYPNIPSTVYTSTGSGSTYYFFINNLVSVNTEYAIPSFKRGSKQRFGIVYSDKYGRLSSVITDENLEGSVTWWRDINYINNNTSGIAANIFNQIGIRYAQLTLNHDAPEWAEKFHIVKTNRNGLKRYVSLPMAKQKFLGKRQSRKKDEENQIVFNEFNDKYFLRGYISPNSVPTSGTSYSVTTAASLGGVEVIYIPLNALTNNYNSSYSELSTSNITYSFTPGDRLRIAYRIPQSASATSATTDYGDTTMDFEILSYLPELNSIAIRVSDMPSFMTSGGFPSSPFDNIFGAGAGNESNGEKIGKLLFEIYTPDNDYSIDYFYEIYSGDIDKSVSGRYLHKGNLRNQTTAQSAIINLFNGDTFLKPRTYVTEFDNTDSTTISASATTKITNFYVEEANYYDKSVSKTWGAGRPNVTIKSSSQTDEYAGAIKEYVRPTTMRYSEPLLANQGFNGLGTIYDTSFEDANPSLRSIQLLHTDGGKTYVFHEDAVGVMQNDRQVITTVDGQNLSIAANTPISDITYYNTRAGIGTNPESFAYMNNRKYFFDADQGQVCRISNDGVTPINMYGMDRYFKQVSRAMNTNAVVDYAFGGYDKRFNEYILSFRIGGKITYTPGQTALGVNTITVSVDLSVNDVFLGQITRIYLPAVPASTLAPSEYDIYVSNIAGNNVTYTLSAKAFLDISTVLTAGLSYQIGIYGSQTVAFNEDANAWSSFYSYIPDMISSAGVELVTYRAGALYVHDAVNSPMNFYGTSKDGYIDIVSNPQPAQVKVWNTMSLNTLFTNEAGVDTMSIPTTQSDVVDQSMLSGVVTSNNLWTSGTGFTYKEQQAFTDYMRTISRPTGATNFIEGEKVRGFWQKTRIKFAGGQVSAARIISATFNYFMSNYTR